MVFKGRRIQHLGMLAASLMLLVIALTVTVLFLNTPDGRRFDQALLAAELAISEGHNHRAALALHRASFHALSSSQWTEVFTSTAKILKTHPSAPKYRLLKNLARRAVKDLPGHQQFRAYYVWGELRLGHLKRASNAAEQLGSTWSSLKAEAHLAYMLKQQDISINEFTQRMKWHKDPEFFDQMATIIESLELAFDAALLYMQSGRYEKALELSEKIASGGGYWNSSNTPYRYDVYGAIGRMAFDAGLDDKAAAWISLGLDNARTRRTVSWENLHLLGDIYWNMYKQQGSSYLLSQAGEMWYEALKLISPENADSSPPDAWRLRVNLAAFEQIHERYRKAGDLLRQSVELYPARSETKVAWARYYLADNPEIVGRLIRETDTQALDPMLALLALQAGLEPVTPHLYEAKLWTIFDAVMEPETDVQAVDARHITEFFLNYISSRKRYASIDALIDQYLKILPGSDWILSWRLAADASRNIAVIDLIAPQSGEPSPYRKFLARAEREKNWRSLHDLALYELMAARELAHLINTIPEAPTQAEGEARDAFLLSSIASYQAGDEPLRDRIQTVIKRRTDLQQKQLDSKNRRGRTLRSAAKKSLMEERKIMIERALEKLDFIVNNAELAESDLNTILLLKVAVLEEEVS